MLLNVNLPTKKEDSIDLSEITPEYKGVLIIFIKDTDGDIAEEHMNNISGKKWLIKADSQISSKILERN